MAEFLTSASTPAPAERPTNALLGRTSPMQARGMCVALLAGACLLALMIVALASGSVGWWGRSAARFDDACRRGSAEWEHGAEPGGILLNMDTGIGALSVPWGVEPARGALCDRCVPADVDDSYVLAYALKVLRAGAPIAYISHTFGNTDFASGAFTVFALMTSLGWNHSSCDDTVRWVHHLGTVVTLPMGSAQTPAFTAYSNQQYVLTPSLSMGTTFELQQTWRFACVNAVVVGMRDRLRTLRGATIVATGPLQDVACLFTVFPEVRERVSRVHILAGRLGRTSLSLSDGERSVNGLTDFNIRVNPYAAQLLIEQALPGQLFFFPFGLTSDFETSIAISEMPTEANPFVYEASAMRAEWYERVLGFGQRIWPWDMYPFYAALHPDKFNCSRASARLTWCESSSVRYISANNSCVDHAVAEGLSMEEAAQLFLFEDGRGDVNVCTSWRDAGDKSVFKQQILRNVFRS